LEPSNNNPSSPSYLEFVNALTKCPHDIVSTLSPSQADLIHCVLGISGEAGELLDAVKKHAIYGKELDFDNLVEELGDLEFYMQRLRSNIGVTREEVISKNMQKLSKRYKSLSYSDSAAINREDKSE
jgi:NTP pyrophosphatase (non-canonical NTP hydrolase)